MIDPAIQDRREDLRQRLTVMQLRRADAILGEAEKRAKYNRTEQYDLLACLTDRDIATWQTVIKMSKAALIDWMISDQLIRLDAEIARLEQELADSQPSPMWQAEETAQ